MSTNTESANPDAPGGDKSQRGLRNDEDIQNILFGTLWMGVVGLVPAIFLWSPKTLSAMMAALACYGIGSIIGLLFGIPRSLQGTGINAKPGQAAANSEVYGDNSNLEQISDWLTKILIGASLVQMREIKDLVAKLAERLAGTPRTSSEFAFSLFVIVYFLTLGFIGSYLLARIYLPAVLKRAKEAASRTEALAQDAKDAAMQAIADVKKAGEQASAAAAQAVSAGDEAKKAAELALSIGRISGAVDPQPPPANAKATQSGALPLSKTGSEVSNQQNAALSDPNKGKFGGQSKANGRVMSAKVTEVPSSSEHFMVRIEVTSETDAPLTEPVVFYLHPTFREQKVTVEPSGGIALLEKICWGAFTVGAETDGGKTRLELDLALLPGAPEKFTSR